MCKYSIHAAKTKPVIIRIDSPGCPIWHHIDAKATIKHTTANKASHWSWDAHTKAHTNLRINYKTLVRLKKKKRDRSWCTYVSPQISGVILSWRGVSTSVLSCWGCFAKPSIIMVTTSHFCLVCGYSIYGPNYEMLLILANYSVGLERTCCRSHPQ